MSQPERQDYTPVMKAVHWTTVLMVLALLGIGWTMTGGLGLSRMTLGALFALHKSLGVSVLVLTLFRLYWRAGHPAPPLPPGLRPWEVVVVGVVHRLLYLLLLIQPLTGWCIYSLSPRRTAFFGLFPIPPLPFPSGLAGNVAVREVLEGLHGAGAGLLALLVVLHAGAAFKHHFVARDTVLLRMSPRAAGPWLERLRGRR